MPSANRQNLNTRKGYMNDRLFLSEYVSKTRTAHVFKRLEQRDFVVFCFCCGHETETEPFDTEQLAEDWAEDWVEKTVELDTLNTDQEHTDCKCSD